MDSFVITVIILFIIVIGIIIFLNIYKNNDENYDNIGYPNTPYDSTPINKLIFRNKGIAEKTFLNRNDGMNVEKDFKNDVDRIRFPDTADHVNYSPYECKI